MRQKHKKMLLGIFLLALVLFTVGGVLEKQKMNTGEVHEREEAVDAKIPEQKNQTEETEDSDTEEKEYNEDIMEELEQTEEEISEKENASDVEDVPDKVSSTLEKTLQGMTLEEKVAQMFFITPEALTGYATVTATGAASKSAFDRYPVGGLVYFAQNLQNPEQTKEMLSGISSYALETKGYPVFLGVDEEGGRVARIGRNAAFQVEKVEAMGVLAQKQDKKIIYQAGLTIGSYLSELGFNVDFAPDTDVLTNADNQVIGDRSFGTDPEQVAELAWAYRDGLHEAGILSAYKHFPGHGGTIEDSHTGYAFSYKTLEELQKSELVPFRSGSEKGIDFVMVSHISTPNVTGDNTPASVSKYWITDILRDDMGYDGIIITDAMAMGAITANYSSADATVLAVQAGCDMILMPQDFAVSYEALLEAVRDGEISETRIEESVGRILRAKLKD